MLRNEASKLPEYTWALASKRGFVPQHNNVKLTLMKQHNHFVYITTNVERTVLYTGVTNDLERRLSEHKQDSQTTKTTFAGKYNCFYLIYYERYSQVTHAIEREKEVKGWVRQKKERLIAEFNPEWKFLNDAIVD